MRCPSKDQCALYTAVLTLRTCLRQQRYMRRKEQQSCADSSFPCHRCGDFTQVKLRNRRVHCNKEVGYQRRRHQLRAADKHVTVNTRARERVRSETEVGGHYPRESTYQQWR